MTATRVRFHAAPKHQHKHKHSSAKHKHSAVKDKHSASTTCTNPFDRHNNASKAKHIILNRPNKGALRNVSLARSKAHEKRKNTLSKEYRTRHNSNKFMDQRIGESDATMTFEERMMARFQAERKRKLRNKNSYTLESSEDEEENDLFLTHKGNALKDSLNSDPEPESDGDGDKALEKDIVHNFHFGGGERAQNDGPRQNDGRSHVEVMKEVMAKSKLFRAERQENKRNQENVTEALDEQFDTFRNLLEFRPTRKDGMKGEKEVDGYDRLTRELAMESKVLATERKMSPEELAQRERNWLEKMEKERLARMRVTEEDLNQSEDEDNEKVDSIGGNSVKSFDHSETRRKKKASDGKKLSIANLKETGVGREIPYVLECPSTEDAYFQLCKRYESAGEPSEVQNIILERLIGYYSPKLSVNNPQIMCKLYTILHNVFTHYAKNYVTHKRSIDVLSKHLITLSSELPNFTGQYYRKWVENLVKTSVLIHKWPSLEDILTIQLMIRIFSITDFRHNVISPLETLLAQLLFSNSIRKISDVTHALMTAGVLLHINIQRDRFSPELILSFERILICMRSNTYKKLLLKFLGSTSTSLPLLSIQSPSTATPSLAAETLGSLNRLILLFLQNYKSNPSIDFLTIPIQKQIDNLLQTLSPVTSPQLDDLQHTLLNTITQCHNNRQSLRLLPHSAPTLPSFAPKYDVNYTVRKDKTNDKEKITLNRLQRQVKRARKSAARELRRDSEFLAQEKQTEDLERKEQKKSQQRQIHAWLEEQNATFNQQVRKGKHMLKGGGSGVAKGC